MSLNQIQVSLPGGLTPSIVVKDLAGDVIGGVTFVPAALISTSPPGTEAGAPAVTGVLTDSLFDLRPLQPGPFPFAIDQVTGAITITAVLPIGLWTAQLYYWGRIMGQRIFCVLQISGVVTDAGAPDGTFILGVSVLGGTDIA